MTLASLGELLTARLAETEFIFRVQWFCRFYDLISKANKMESWWIGSGSRHHCDSIALSLNSSIAWDCLRRRCTMLRARCTTQSMTLWHAWSSILWNIIRRRRWTRSNFNFNIFICIGKLFQFCVDSVSISFYSSYLFSVLCFNILNSDVAVHFLIRCAKNWDKKFLFIDVVKGLYLMAYQVNAASFGAILKINRDPMTTIFFIRNKKWFMNILIKRSSFNTELN